MLPVYSFKHFRDIFILDIFLECSTMTFFFLIFLFSYKETIIRSEEKYRHKASKEKLSRLT